MWFNYCYCLLYLITVLVTSAYCENTTESTEKLLETYRNYVNASHELARSDRNLMKIWTSDFLLQVVNITSHYRLEMTRHKEHNFMGIKANTKWKDCMNLHEKEIDKAETTYYDGESKCLKTANEEGDEKKQAVCQVEKEVTKIKSFQRTSSNQKLEEIRKWRKSYKYLSHQCNVNNPGDIEAAGECLVEYIQKDNYHLTFQRLILLKLESMSELYNQILVSVRNLEACLKTILSLYLTNVRLVMDNLNRCYNIKT